MIDHYCFQTWWKKWRKLDIHWVLSFHDAKANIKIPMLNSGRQFINSFISIYAFPLWEIEGRWRGRTLHTNSNLIYCSTAGTTTKREQARWEIHIGHLDLRHPGAAFAWVQPVACALPNFHRAFCTHSRIIVAVESLRGRIVARHSGIYEIQSCALCREVLLRERFPTSPISVICTWDGNILVITHNPWP